ncbi:hypothetical protein [Streptomyces otsuchiensis]|uniref:hypothetical protein n=1 Tax=Streptomyces otsuchiensis TaxID=2681388 RepID=UPI00130024D8|nr:hypothetical protein [Streptomyces otsuchiensis]
MTRAEWVPPVAGAVALWALIWFVCTPARLAALVEAADENGDRGTWSLVWWLIGWSHREPDGAARWTAGEWIGTGLVTTQVLLTVALFAAGSALVLRLLPPVGRRWPLTWLACWWAAVAASVVGTGLVAPLVGLRGRDNGLESWDQTEEIGVFRERSVWMAVYELTGQGAPLFIGLGLVAGGVVTGAAVVRSRRLALLDGNAGQAIPGRSDSSGDGRALLRAAGAATALLALLVAALGGSWRHDGFADRRPGAGEVLVERWLVPADWHVSYAGQELWVLLLLAVPAVLQVLLFGAAFWAVLRPLRRRSLPALLLTGAWTGLAAGAVGRALFVGADQLLFASGPGDTWWAGPLSLAADRAGGAMICGALAGAAAWLLLWRIAPDCLRPAEERGPEGHGGEAPPGAERGDDGPDDELVITVGR